jgi:hypothetical protein
MGVLTMGSLYSGAALIVVAWAAVENSARNWELARIVLLMWNSDDRHG